jgi:hypothetical protein
MSQAKEKCRNAAAKLEAAKLIGDDRITKAELEKAVKRSRKVSREMESKYGS